VDRGALVVADGTGPDRRVGRFFRLDVRRGRSQMRRLVIASRDGSLSLAAVSWCHAQGITVAQVGGDGSLVWASAPPGLDDARRRRAQAIAGLPGSPVGLAIVRELLSIKLAGEDALLQTLQAAPPATAAAALAREALAGATNLEEARTAEAASASALWETLADRPVPWIARDRGAVPDHWLTIGPRSSPLGGTGPRRAVTPFHAALNVSFAALELEATIACQVLGLDPGLGILHSDTPGRNSLACDLMEAVRPQVVG